MTRMHSADIARRANKHASWIDDPELWAELEAQEAEKKGKRGSSQMAWTLSEKGADVLLDYLGLPKQKPEPLADILLDQRVDADELIEVMTKKLGGNPIFWRGQAAKLAGYDRNASPIILTQQQAIQLLSKIWGSE